MQSRRHHNNKGYRQIKNGGTHKSLQRIIRRVNPMKSIIKNVKQLASSDGNVWKYIFEFDGAITEAVLYKYGSFEQRTVLCVSVQSGCPVGCTFCGTGENFLRNLTAKEIMAQVVYIFMEKGIVTGSCEKLQIMLMSMGEPFLNYNNVEAALKDINDIYPTADLLVSTIAPTTTKFDNFVELSTCIDKIGLQFSLHKSNDEDRDKLIPFSSKSSIAEIVELGTGWFSKTGRKPYVNYCIDGTNNTEKDYSRITAFFNKDIFCFTFSVVCSADETMKDAGYKNMREIEKFQSRFIDAGYDTRVFDPAGQDDIGGGCGQLWFVQEYMDRIAKELMSSLH